MLGMVLKELLNDGFFLTMFVSIKNVEFFTHTPFIEPEYDILCPVRSVNRRTRVSVRRVRVSSCTGRSAGRCGGSAPPGC